MRPIRGLALTAVASPLRADQRLGLLRAESLPGRPHQVLGQLFL